MRNRIFFLLPNVDVAKQVVDELLLARIEERHMHVVVRQDTPMEDLPEPDMAVTRDVVGSTVRGLAAGGGTGLVAGLVAITVPPLGVIAGGGLVAATTAAGAGFGAWMSSMIGVSLPNRDIKKFDAAIQAGKVLMMVDVPPDELRAVEDRVIKHHPEAEIAGLDPHKPAFP